MSNNVDRARWAEGGLRAHQRIRQSEEEGPVLRGQRAIETYACQTGVESEDLETQLSDFHCDIRHLADEKRIEWSEVENRTAISIRSSVIGRSKKPTPCLAALGVLFSDLRCFAEAKGVLWCNVLQRSSAHYEAETACTCPHCKANGDPECDYKFDDKRKGEFAICYRCGESFDLSAALETPSKGRIQ